MIATMLLTCSALSAQIADAKVESGAVRVYHEGENYPSYSLSLDRNCELSGFNTKYIVITCNNFSVRIYKDNEYNSSYSIALNKGSYVKNVTSSSILIQDPGVTRYYDFNGKFIKSTKD